MNSYYRIWIICLLFSLWNCTSTSQIQWKKYENEYFSIEYPDDWNVAVAENGTITISEGPGNTEQ